MALDPKKWTTKTQQAVAAALDSAHANANPELTPDHLLAALLRQDDSIVLPVLQRLGLAPLMVREPGRRGCRRVSAQGVRHRRAPHEPRDHRGVRGRRAGPEELRDDYLSAEHLLLALGRSPRRRPRGAAVGAARRPREPPCHQPEPRGAVPGQGTAATSPRPPARAASTRSSVATTRSGGSSRCCRAA